VAAAGGGREHRRPPLGRSLPARPGPGVAVEALLDATRRRGLPPANVDLALAALAHVAEMTRGAAEAIFAVARVAGWLAHALEEYDRATPIRLRAVYTGPSPSPT
jgi:citrate synthase